ncbi:MAG: transglutaminase-like cysteine peptidase [Desulfovibrionaceae bacterium]
MLTTKSLAEENSTQAAPAPESTKTAPPPPSNVSPTPKRIQLFGTVEFKGNLKTLTQWLNVMKEHKKHPIFIHGSKLNATVLWDNWKVALEKMPPFERIKAVNSFWNKWPYRQDKDVYGKEDYWAAPYLFRKNSGDCEDYCIAKYFTLREVGFTSEQMRIVIVMEKIRNIPHAIVVVYINNDAYILDNLTNSVLSHTKSRNYAPQYSVNEQFRWAHVRPKTPQ